MISFYERDLKAKGLEIIFVSSDKDEVSWTEYLKEMPWKALPYSDRMKKKKLSKQFKVMGIPALVILDVNGELLAEDGKDMVLKDPTGVHFPWRCMDTLKAEQYLAKDGSKKSFQEMCWKSDILGLFLSDAVRFKFDPYIKVMND